MAKEQKKNKMMELSEAAIEKFMEFGAAHFQEYLTQREEGIDEAYARACWMYNGGSSRAEYDSEKGIFVDRIPTSKCNVGSPVYHRYINTQAGELCGVLMSGHPLFKYRDIQVHGNPDAEETGRVTADQVNALAEWIMKADRFNTKMPEFSVSVCKLSNVFAMISMKYEERTVWEPVPEFIDTGEVDENGLPVIVTETRLKRRKGELFSYPTVTFPYPCNVYANQYISNIQDQECVFVLSQTTKHALQLEGKWLDQEAVNKIDVSKLKWDGMYGAIGKKPDPTEHGESEVNPSQQSLLRWDIYSWVPVKNGEWVDEEELSEEERENGIEMELMWITVIGNSLDPTQSVCVKAVSGFDPKSEIPIYSISVSPDSSDLLYHTFQSEVVRPMYAADCAVMNTNIDNFAIRNDPPMTVIDGIHRIKDFSMKPGQRWPVDTHEVVKLLEIPDTAQYAAALRDQIRSDVQTALAADDNKVGQYAGARTSATEFMGVAGNTQLPVILRNKYVVNQFAGWVARRYIDYIKAYVPTKVIRAILNEEMIYPPTDKEIFLGDYDVVVDVVDEYEVDQQITQKADRVMQILASNPQLLQSSQHEINMMEFVKFYLERNHFPSRIVRKRSGDSESNARQRIQGMLLTGVYQPPVEGEDVETHLRIARAERVRWKGVEGSGDPREANIPLLDQYIEQLKVMSDGQAAPAGGGGEVPGLPAEQTPGQMVGNEQAAMLGAEMGGF